MLAFSLAFISVSLSGLAMAQESGDVNVTIYTSSQTCYKTSNSAIWSDSLTGANTTVFAGGTTTGNCSQYYLKNGALVIIPECCPIDYSCNFSSGKCYIASISRCGQYTDAASCNGAPDSIAKNSVNDSSKCKVSGIYTRGGLDCVNRTDCQCLWNASARVCQGLQNYSIHCDPRQDGGGITPQGECIWTPSVEENKCNLAESVITITSAAHWFSPPGKNLPKPIECADLKRDYPCVSLAKLDFWTNASIFILIGFIVGVYIYNSRKQYL